MVSAACSSGHTDTPLDVKLFCVFGAIGGVIGMYDAVVSLSLSPSDGIATLPIVFVQFAVVGFETLREIKLVVGLVAVVYLASRYRLYR